MSRKQQLRVEIITRMQGGRFSKMEAAQTLEVTRRQVDNIIRRYEVEGISSVVHGNTGKTPALKTSVEVVERIIQLAGKDGKYHDFSVCHLQEMLAEHEEIRIGRSTLDRLLKNRNLRQARSDKRGACRQRRTRSSAEGLMVQIDGSLHDWLEGRGPRMVLMGAIDDATGKILFLQFWQTECKDGYLSLFRHIAVTYGLPQTYYHDRHTMLQSPKALTIQEELDGKEALSELQRVLKLLGVVSIGAHSPQAKGRIERLWGTLQQRLVKELRLAGIDDLANANAFLPAFIERYNARFAIEAADSQSAWVALKPNTDLDYYFASIEPRVVSNDHVVRWHNRTFLILRTMGERCLARTNITVHLTPEGKINLYDGTTRLRYKELAGRPQATPPSKPAPKPAREPDPEARRRRLGWLHSGMREGGMRPNASSSR